ncbi:MAG TPA: saccharopine dehydrogenase C-terminal domain-containing protein [Gemmatimonadales bacterium]|nr:saccharopine dehydrogenase C-terminal domain-containing protein [Gemmatimonadales bacterium]
MKFLVLGAGLQGSAAAYHLLQHRQVEQVTLADHHPARLPAFLSESGARLRPVALEAKDAAAAANLMRGHDAVLCALPYYFNEPMTCAAIEAGCHFCDLGGNTDIVLRQQKLHSDAAARGVSVIPDCGLAPGMVNILAAEGIRRLEPARSVKIYVGGLPQHPEPPLNYQIVYSLEGALDYYSTPSWVLRQGKAVQVDALSELETQQFPSPVGTLEAFHTGGGISTLPFAYEGRIETMEYKTLRYPGHAAIMRPIRELGLISTTPIPVKGHPVVPRELFIAAVGPRLLKPGSPDVVALRVLVTGERDGKSAAVGFELLDYYDGERGISAMMRATGFSLALTALLQADGTIPEKGVHTPDEVVPFGPYVEGLARFGVKIEQRDQ